MTINIDFSKLDFKFSKKPLVIGGMAMEYYGLRKTGNDIDLIVTKEDFTKLAKKYPKKLKDLRGDFGVCAYEFEIWKTILYYNYKFWSKGAIEKKDFLMMSIKKLLFLKVLAIKDPKCLKDVKLISQLLNSKIPKEYERLKRENDQIIKGIGEVKYLEKK